MPLLQQYYDQVMATRSAPKTSMAEEIDRMKEIRTNVESLNTNPCTIKLSFALVNAMNSSIGGFLALLSGKPESQQEIFFDEGTKFIRQVNLELSRLADCKENCKP